MKLFFNAVRGALLATVLLPRTLEAQISLKPLTSDEIALVINQHVPQSRELAEFYAQARGIPADRIIALDLPTIEDMPFDRYDRSAAPTVRKFLIDKNLRDKIRCLVTFYGVPLRIADRTNELPENSELGRLRETSKFVSARLVAMIGDLERQAAEFDKSFQPASSDTSLDWLIRRLDHAGQNLNFSLRGAPDPQTREKIAKTVAEISSKFAAPVDLDGKLPMGVIAPTNPSTRPIEELLDRPYDRFSRSDLREQMRRSGGILGYLKTIQDQINYLTPDATGAAFDSELSLIWWPPYARTRWQPNTMNPHFREMRGTAPVTMVMRLDAPNPQMVRDLITNSIATEREGLRGQFAIDARGIAPKDAAGKLDAFGVFDERLRSLAATVQSRTAMQLTLDNKPEVFAPNSVNDVALYCGWYSVRSYVPGMKFNRGAVGYHVASYELLTLHTPLEGGWVRGLLSSGVVGTLGSVAEPYLHSFPLPEEFFPLLLTGKLPLAQVYWTTTPLTSWMQVCIGDPLYTPYAKNPMLKGQDLPEGFRPLVLRTNP